MTASMINVALGILVTVSAYCFDRTAADRLLVSAFLGPPIAIFSAMGLRYPKASYIAAIAGFLLAAESTMEGNRGLLLPVDMILGLLVMAVALYPHSYLWAEGPPTSDVL